MDRFTVAKPDKGEARSYRDEWIDKFLAKINPEREKAGYPPYTYSRFGGMLKKAGYGTNDLERLYTECSEARSFGALLAYKLRR